MIRKASYDKLELLKHSFGRLEGQTAARLPAPPFLMFDRITQIADEEVVRGGGREMRELDVRSAYPEAFLLQPLDQVAPDEAARTDHHRIDVLQRHVRYESAP